MRTTNRKMLKTGLFALLLCVIWSVPGCRGNDSVSQTPETESAAEGSITEPVSSAPAVIPDESTTADEHTERTADGRVKHTFHLADHSELISVTVPESWERGVDCFTEVFADAGKEYKRMEVVDLRGIMTEEEWTESLSDVEGPLTGVTDEGVEYIGYYGDPPIEKDANWRIYYFLILSENGGLYAVSINQSLDRDPADYFEKAVLPAVQSVGTE